MVRVLITGVTSFPGRAVAQRFADVEVEVHAIIRPTSDLSRLDSLSAKPRLHIHDGTAEHMDHIVGDVKPDVIVHLAGRYVAEPTPDDIQGMTDDNVTFGAMVVDAAVKAGVTGMVTAGSYVQYAKGGGPDASPAPLNTYAETKEAFQSILDQARIDHGLSTCSLILYDTYGPGDWRPRLMAALTRAATIGSTMPTPVNDVALQMVHIDDVAKAFATAARLLVMNPGQIDGRRFAVRSDQPQTIADIAKVFEAESGKPMTLNIGGYQTTAPVVEDLWMGDLLSGWTAKVSLAVGVRQLLGEQEAES